MADMVSTKSPFEIFYGVKPKIIGSFLEFGRIGYVFKREKFRKKITDQIFKKIVLGYADNHTRDT